MLWGRRRVRNAQEAEGKQDLTWPWLFHSSPPPPCPGADLGLQKRPDTYDSDSIVLGGLCLSMDSESCDSESGNKRQKLSSPGS